MEEHAGTANKPTPKFRRQLDRITEAWTEALEQPLAAGFLRIAAAEVRNLIDRPPLDEEQLARCFAAIEDVVQTLAVASPEVIAMLGTPQVRSLLAERVGLPRPPPTTGNLRLRSVEGAGELRTLLEHDDVVALRTRLAARQVWLNVTDLSSDQFRDQWPAISYQQQILFGPKSRGGRPRGARDPHRAAVVAEICQRTDLLNGDRMTQGIFREIEMIATRHRLWEGDASSEKARKDRVRRLRNQAREACA